jgi:hypothetical protein
MMAIIRGPITIVFKTSNRSNAKVKLKTYKNKTIDDVLTKAKISGIPEKAIILEVGMGSTFEEKFKEKYNL